MAYKEFDGFYGNHQPKKSPKTKRFLWKCNWVDFKNLNWKKQSIFKLLFKVIKRIVFITEPKKEKWGILNHNSIFWRKRIIQGNVANYIKKNGWRHFCFVKSLLRAVFWSKNLLNSKTKPTFSKKTNHYFLVVLTLKKNGPNKFFCRGGFANGNKSTILKFMGLKDRPLYVN